MVNGRDWKFGTWEAKSEKELVHLILYSHRVQSWFHAQITNHSCMQSIINLILKPLMVSTSKSKFVFIDCFQIYKGYWQTNLEGTI